MIKVKLLPTMSVYAGPRGVFRAGDVLELPDNEARGLIDSGYAVDITPVVVTPPPNYFPPEPVLKVFPETADLPDVEQAVKPRRGKKAA